MPLLNIGEKAWKYERISEYYFKANASTGDLLLFRSKDLASSITRGLIGSKYDHVGLILCYLSGKVCLLEATHSNGVTVTPWNQFVANGWHLFSERIVYRKLECERTEDCLLKLDEFVGKVKGKTYKLWSNKLIINKIQAKPGDEENFFCSELLASAYKALGLLPETKPSSYYLPGHFSQDQDLQLIGAKLSPEQVIDFDL